MTALCCWCKALPLDLDGVPRYRCNIWLMKTGISEIKEAARWVQPPRLFILLNVPTPTSHITHVMCRMPGVALRSPHMIQTSAELAEVALQGDLSRYRMPCLLTCLQSSLQQFCISLTQMLLLPLPWLSWFLFIAVFLSTRAKPVALLLAELIIDELCWYSKQIHRSDHFISPKFCFFVCSFQLVKF